MPHHFVMACMSRKLIRKRELIDNLVQCIGVPGREVSRIQCQVPFYRTISLMIQKVGERQLHWVCRRVQLRVIKEAGT